MYIKITWGSVKVQFLIQYVQGVPETLVLINFQVMLMLLVQDHMSRSKALEYTAASDSIHSSSPF